MSKTYIQKSLMNPDILVIENRTHPNENTVCECPPDTDIEVFNIVDSIDELTQEVVGKKLEFSEEKYEQKQVRLQQAEQARITEEQRKADLGFLASTDWYVVRQMETGVAMPLEIKTLRAEARERL